MAIVKHLTDMHGGSVSVRSALGQGSRFTIQLPPNAPASDAVFLRRVYLDVIGRIPTADEAAAFLLSNTLSYSISRSVSCPA